MGLELEGAKPLAVAAADELLRLRHPHPSVRQAADRILGGDPLNGLIVQVFSEVLRRAHPRDQLASACVVQVLVQRLHRDTLTNLARVEAIPAATDDPCVGRSEEHTSELQSLMRISYAVFCLKKKNKHKTNTV